MRGREANDRKKRKNGQDNKRKHDLSLSFFISGYIGSAIVISHFINASCGAMLFILFALAMLVLIDWGSAE
jgi:hypothetical protein